MSLPKHGANPHYLYKQLGLAMPERTIDFSVNLNPLGPPRVIFDQWDEWQELIVNYPDPLGNSLKQKVAEKEGLQPNEILLGNGAAELIQLLAIYFRDKKIALFQPTFSEYERMCAAYGASLTNLSVERLDDEAYLDEALNNQEAVFLCHPSNPTGEIYTRETLENLLAICERKDCYLILDEAFYDFSDEVHTMVSSIKDSPYLIILRSVTKMYSIAGIRLGMLFANETLVSELRAYQSYWSVNALALAIGEVVLDEEDFVQETQAYIANIRAQVFPKLKELGFILTKSKVNFFLLRDPALGNQKELLLFLLKKGIIPRHTENYPYLAGEWLRFAIRPLDEMNELLEALREWKIN